MSGSPGVLIIPGLNGHPGMLMRYAPSLFPDWDPVPFNHHLDQAARGVDGLAERALRQIESIGEPMFVCGESFGGTVALTMAHMAPERFAGLILFSAFGWHPSNLARAGAGALALWSFLGGRVGMPVYRAGRLASLPTQLGLRFSPEMLRDYVVDRPRADVDAYRAKALLSLSFDARPWIGSIQTPTFILTGRWDAVVPVSAGRELARSMPNTKLVSLGGGHLVHLVNAERVGWLISNWARSLH